MTPRANEEDTLGPRVNADLVHRRERITPRQLWASRQQAQSAPSQAPSETAPEAPEESAGVDEAPSAPAAFFGEQPDETGRDEPAGEAARDEADLAPAGPDGPQDTPQAEPAPKPEPKMVDPSMQPGAMRYPYATHGRPPEDDEQRPAGATWRAPEEGGHRTLLVGLLVLGAVLVFGLILANQHHRLRALQDRVAELERLVSPACTTP